MDACRFFDIWPDISENRWGDTRLCGCWNRDWGAVIPQQLQRTDPESVDCVLEIDTEYFKWLPGMQAREKGGLEWLEGKGVQARATAAECS